MISGGMARSRAPRLPIALTPILGRTRELDETAALLAETRLLTIMGPGGSGKTRLALELAHRVRDQFEQAVWVDLAAIEDSDDVAQAVGDAMGLRELAADDVLQSIVDSVRDRSVLFVLDNCEHVVGAAAFVAEEILRTCGNVSIVATTREALGVPGEQKWRVPPLSLADAILLFEQRAKSVVSTFVVDGEVAKICERLDGIPLAIELAAARVNVLSPAEIAARLDDSSHLLAGGTRTLPRHRTIHETIDWSYRLLSPEEQLLFRRLAVFASRFTIDAAETVAGDDVDALGALAGLTDKSLLLFEDGRYRLLDTVRQFAAEKLAESGERDAVAARHAEHVLTVAEELAPRLAVGRAEPDALARIDDEIGNIRAILDRAAGTDAELRLVFALHWYWFARSQFSEARRRTSCALGRAGTGDPLVRARASIAAATAASWQGDWAALQPLVEPAIPVLRDSGDQASLATALMLLGVAEAFAESDHDAAAESFAAARRIAPQAVRPLVAYWAGLAGQLRGDLDAARDSFEEAQRAATADGNAPAAAHSMTALGHLALRTHDRVEAVRCFRAALNPVAGSEDRWALTQAAEGVGLLLLDSQSAETGTRLLAAASAAALQMGARPSRDAAFASEKNERILEALGDERLRVVLASGAAMSFDAMIALAREQLDQLGTPGRVPLTVRALGPLQIVRAGEPVEESARSRELLLFLLCHPSGRTKEQIGAALWPDAEPAKLRNNFHVTLHRLRKSLGAAEWIVVDGDTYAVDRSRGVEFDAETFEREASAAIRTREPRRLAAATELYRGDFFESAAAGEWYLPIRNRLRDLQARALESLGRARTAAGDHAAAAEAYERLFGLDDLNEDAARLLIDSLVLAGDPSAARRAWRRLADALRRELGEKPTIPAP